ncbi:MAG: hypothetical protein Salg2KO_02590 [Salibacteraceae bacterium]
MPFTHLGIASRPTFLIIGAQKAGTSGLHRVLNQHPNLCGTELKEVHYFDNDQWYSPSNTSQYLSRFPLPIRSRDQHYFESTPSYLYHPKVAERIQMFDAKIKLIVALRDPAERALSAWKMYHYGFKTGYFQHLHDPRPFQKAIEEELNEIDTTTYYSNPTAYVKRGMYAEQIARYLHHFPSGQILFLEQQEILHDLDHTLHHVFDFLGVESLKLPQVIANKGQETVDNAVLDAMVQLREFYKPHNIKLAELLQRQFSWT